jgi:tetratricopeptide (TPR) repeat protein
VKKPRRKHSPSGATVQGARAVEVYAAPANREVQPGPAGAASASSKALFWVAIGLIVANLAVYEPVRHYGFVLYDDLEYVTGNANLQGAPLWQSIQFALTATRSGAWAPVTALSHVFDIQLFGSDAGPQHVENVLFHVFNSLLLFVVLWQMTRQWVPSSFVAALFALHPLHVESVAWIAERKDVLSTFFLLLTIWAYTRYVRKPGSGRYLLVVLLFAVGLMTKPMLVTLPLILLLLDAWPLGRVRFERSQLAQWLRLVYEKIPLLAMAGAAGIATLWTSSGIGGIESFETLPLATRLSNASVSLMVYIRDMFWPSNLAPFYPYEPIPTWEIVASLAGLLTVSALALWNARRRPYLLVGWLWYAVMIVPVSGLLQAGGQARADRFTYVPLIGLFIAAAWGIPEILAGWKHRQAGLSIAAALVLIACFFAARRQVNYWENAFTLWQHTLEVTKENYVAHTVLGFALASEGKIDEGMSHYREAIRIQPAFAESHSDLGIALAQTGRIDEAISEFQDAVRLAQDAAITHYDLGFALAARGRTQEAVAQYSEAIRLQAGYVEALTKRGDAYLTEGQLNEAIADYLAALQVQPNFADALDNLGLALANQGKLDEAIARYNEALRVRPNFAEAHNNLGSALTNQGRFTDAIAQFTEALRIQPDNQLAHENLAAALELQKKAR